MCLLLNTYVVQVLYREGRRSYRMRLVIIKKGFCCTTTRRHNSRTNLADRTTSSIDECSCTVQLWNTIWYGQSIFLNVIDQNFSKAIDSNIR